MNVFVFFDRAWNKLLRKYRSFIFKNSIKAAGDHIHLVGKVTLINRNISVGNNVTIYPDCMFFGDGPIVIGDNVDIGNGTIIYASKCGGVYIGDNTMIAAQCYIIDTDHGISRNGLMREQRNTVDKVFIGTDCWLGANVTVLKGANIGDGAVIGAKSLVKGNVAPYAIAVGIPARKMKERI